MYCQNCGKKIGEDADYCLGCGKMKDSIKTVSNDENPFIWGLLGFFVPVAGLILYLVWKQEKPKSAKAAGIGALIGSIGIILIILIIIMIPFLLYTSYANVQDSHKCASAVCGECYREETTCSYFDSENEKFQIIKCPCDEN